MISIVVPAYNAAGVIGRCIDTVLRQTYPDFELLIIDDGSTDETAEIVAAKAAQDARIHLIRQENAGVSSARNTGIAAASGELLCFIDSDDTVSANYLETLHTLYSPGVLPVIDVVRSDCNGSALNPRCCFPCFAVLPSLEPTVQDVQRRNFVFYNCTSVIVNVPGTSVMGAQKHAEYQVDPDALLEMVLDIFYEPVDG